MSEVAVKLKSVSVTRAAKINLGNFENTDVSITMTADVVDDNLLDVINELTDLTTGYIKSEGKRIEKAAKSSKGAERY